MRDTPVDPRVVALSDRSLLPGSGDGGAASTTSAADAEARSTRRANNVSLAILLLGVALLSIFPLVGALLLATAGVGFATSWDALPSGSPVTNGNHRNGHMQL